MMKKILMSAAILALAIGGLKAQNQTINGDLTVNGHSHSHGRDARLSIHTGSLFGTSGPGGANLSLNGPGNNSFKLRSDGNFSFTGNNIGVGTFTPIAKLDIRKTKAGDTQTLLNIGLTNNAQSRVKLGIEDWHGVLSIFDAADTEDIKLDAGGNSYINSFLGVGTTDPKATLHVQHSWRPTVLLTYNHESNANNGNGMAMEYHEGAKALKFYSTTNYNEWEKTLMTLKNNGQVGIGVTTFPSDQGYKLAVDGKIICEEMKVALSQSWGDFVFDKEYDLMSLENVENYISENSHLPGIPSANKVESDGLELGEMQRLQMIKIEELTLHLIKQNELIKTLSETNQKLEQRLTALEVE